MDEQMNLFEEGGLADDGMSTEPVTGNDIPPGSMASEVRDDVPAQLSEGEYVVPADVVRFFGVKFFEDLRGEAKSGMLSMEEDGRLGGEPVDPNGVPLEQVQEELSPEEMAMLQQVMAQGQTPDPMAAQMSQMNMGGDVKGYAEGGDVTGYVPPSYLPTSAYGGPSPYGNSGGGMEARQYVNSKTGQMRTFQFIDGKPISFIPPDFAPATDATVDAAREDTVTTENAGSSVGEVEGPAEDVSRGPSGDQDQGSDNETGAPSYGIGGKTASTVAGLAVGVGLGIPGGGRVGAGVGSRAGAFNDARNEYSDALYAEDEDAAAIAAQNVESTFNDLKGLDRTVVFNEGKTAQQTLAEIQARVAEQKTKEANRTQTNTATAPDAPSELAPTTSSRPQSRPSGSGSSGSNAGSSSSGSEDADEGLAGIGGRARGGLITKKAPKKKKPTAKTYKGLAGKR